MSATSEIVDRDATFARLRTVDPTQPTSAPAAEIRSDKGGIVVPLDFPVGDLTSVIVTPPTFGDVEAVVEGIKSELDLHAAMTGLPVETFRSLRWPDAEKIVIAARHLAPELMRH